ncbi:MAG: DUF167 domain-containing protein [bacterium]
MSKAAALKVDADGGDAIFSVRVVPGASSDKICGMADGALRVRIAAPPRDGKANRRLLKFLAKVLGVSAGRIEIAGGEKARLKRIIVRNSDRESIEKN